jgi:cytochrome c biogenesis protein CcmG/thiol:disulfide interchange protein DsbE
MKRLIVVLLVLFFVTACSRSGVELSSGAPDFTLPAVDGTIFRLSDHAGQVVIIDFWATWCPPCQEMIPVLKKLHRNFSDRGLLVLGVSLDNDGLEALGPFVHREMIPYRIVMGDDRVVRAFGGVTTIPTLYIVDREGRLVRKMVGYHSYADLENEIKRYL